MSSVNRAFSKPASILFAPPEKRLVSKPILENHSVDPIEDKFPGGLRLIVKGQGVVFGRLASKENRDNMKGFEFRVDDRKLTNLGPLPRCGDAQHGFRFRVTTDGIILEVQKDNQWEKVCDEKNQPLPGYSVQVKADAGLDSDADCCYWFSIDSHNRVLRYGKGEVRLGTMLAELKYPDAPTDDPADIHSRDPFEWVEKVEFVSYLSDTGNVNFFPLKSFRDPVTTDPAMYVLPMDAITMDDIAHNRATVAANLSETCQKLYYSVAGAKFKLDTPDFPHFSDAIEASIASPQGWCNKILKKKASELQFGGKGPNPDMTYLRITMGINQGDSPGVPFVMEIWPPGHYSPVHNHAGANAIIRVLHGEITVNLYPMLSKSHLQPIGVAKFGKDNVTWISPDLNQTHQLRNTNVAGPTCITIQCYMYEEGDTEHYNYFDYLGDEGEKGHFVPDSDMDYLSFKEQMKREWITLFNNC